jgi:DNA-binding transcriptional MerR regulator/methylmalonyl-CoA mutase cobalamin-binding subunit
MVDGADEPRYPVRVVMSRSGLSADVLRAWERRYGAVRPRRSAGGQRLYSEDDVARLTLLRRATLAGHSIAEIARLDASALEALLEEPTRPREAEPRAEAVDAVVAAAVAAAERLDGAAVEATLKRAAFSFGSVVLVDHVISRFLRRVGDQWHAGTLTPAHEHLASAAVRRVLTWAIDAYAPSPRAPRLVVATPDGELHEFGAMLAAVAAVDEGWRVVYLGASLPTAPIVEAAVTVNARAVVLSAVYANGGDPVAAVMAVARALPRRTSLLVGGAAVADRSDVLRTAGVRVLPDIAALRRTLRSLRTATPAGEHGSDA